MPLHTIRANDNDPVRRTPDGHEGFHLVSNAQRLVDAGLVDSRRALRALCDADQVTCVCHDGSERPVGFLERFTLHEGDTLRIGSTIVRLRFEGRD